MTILVASLKRMYLAKKVTEEQLQAMLKKKQISQKDYEEIVGEKE